ncbi:MAG TPA: hypothetical protein VLJ21_04780 [Candidatus Binatia bacterium]|nr:hypothetical protein [Candidatus Binatia bacterium]
MPVFKTITYQLLEHDVSVWKGAWQEPTYSHRQESDYYRCVLHQRALFPNRVLLTYETGIIRARLCHKSHSVDELLAMLHDASRNKYLYEQIEIGTLRKGASPHDATAFRSMFMLNVDHQKGRYVTSSQRCAVYDDTSVRHAILEELQEMLS